VEDYKDLEYEAQPLMKLRIVDKAYFPGLREVKV